MKKLIIITAAIALATLTGCKENFNFDSSDSSDNRTAGKNGWTYNDDGQIIPAPTPDPIEEALND